MIHIPVCFLVWKGADRRREVWERRGRDVTPIRLGRSKPRYRPVCHLVFVTWFFCHLVFLLGFSDHKSPAPQTSATS
jgi:8-oxo-dGTP pyrophosphatase MutT (NUDIX family)